MEKINFSHHDEDLQDSNESISNNFTQYYKDWRKFEALEAWIIILSWGCVIIGTYLMYCCITYVKSKPPGSQSMLDGIQIQMLWIWILEDGFSVILNTLLFFEHQSYVAAWIIGYGTFVIFVVSQLHLMICVACRIGLIFHQEKVESFLEDHVLLIAM